MPQGGAKDEHFSCFHSSCQWGLTNFYYFVFQLKRVKKRRKKNQKTKKKSQKIKKKKTKIKRKKKRKRQRIRKKLRKRKRVNKKKKKKKKNPKIKRKKKIKKKKRILLKKIRNRVSLTTSSPLEVMSNCHPFWAKKSPKSKTSKLERTKRRNQKSFLKRKKVRILKLYLSYIRIIRDLSNCASEFECTKKEVKKLKLNWNWNWNWNWNSDAQFDTNAENKFKRGSERTKRRNQKSFLKRKKVRILWTIVGIFCGQLLGTVLGPVVRTIWGSKRLKGTKGLNCFFMKFWI